MREEPSAIARALDEAAAPAPDRVAVVDGGRAVTFAGLQEDVGHRAARLRDAGIGPGTRVALVAENSVEFISTSLAVWSLDATLVTIFASSGADELEHALGTSDPGLIIASPTVLAAVRAAAGSRPVADVDVFDVPPTHPSSPNPDGLRAPLALVCFSSGTTSRPKAIMVSAEAIVNCARTYAEVWGLERRDHVVVCLPMAWMYGLASTTLAALLTGASVAIARRARPEGLVDVIGTQGATVLTGVTATYGNIARAADEGRIDPAALDSLRLCISGGEARNEAVFDRWRELTGLEVFDAYCASECLPLVTYDPRVDPVPVPGSAGRLVPRSLLRVVDPDGVEVPRGEIGEAQSSGPGLMLGYWADPEATAKVMTEDGWYRTRDLVRIADSGHVFVTGRLDDLIIRGGTNISPAEVERVLTEEPSVRAACVVGLPDEVYGQRLVAAIVLHEGRRLDPAALQAHATAALTRFKVPSEFIEVDELPVSSTTGKVQRSRVRTLLLDRISTAA